MKNYTLRPSLKAKMSASSFFLSTNKAALSLDGAVILLGYYSHWGDFLAHYKNSA